MTNAVLSIRDQLLAAEAEQQAQLDRDRKRVLVSYAKGESVDFAEMRRVGLTVADCDAWQATYLARVAMFASVEKGRNADSTLEALKAEISANDAEYRRVVEPLQIKANNLESRRMALMADLNAATLARLNLINTATCPLALQEISALEEQMVSLESEARELQADIKLKQGALSDVQAAGPEHWAGDFEADTTAAKAQIEQLQARYDEIQQSNATINDRVREAQDKFLCVPEAIA